MRDRMTLDHVETLECTLCKATYDPDQIIYTCPKHDGVDGILDVVYDYDSIHDRFDDSLDGIPEAMLWLEGRRALEIGDEIRGLRIRR